MTINANFQRCDGFGRQRAVTRPASINRTFSALEPKNSTRRGVRCDWVITTRIGRLWPDRGMHARREGAAAFKTGHCAGGGGLRTASNASSHNRS